MTNFNRSITLISQTTESEETSQRSDSLNGMQNYLTVLPKVNYLNQYSEHSQTSLPSERKTAQIELEMLNQNLHDIRGNQTKFNDHYLNNMQDFRLRYCFSLIKTLPKLFGRDKQ